MANKKQDKKKHIFKADERSINDRKQVDRQKTKSKQADCKINSKEQKTKSREKTNGERQKTGEKSDEQNTDRHEKKVQKEQTNASKLDKEIQKGKEKRADTAKEKGAKRKVEDCAHDGLIKKKKKSSNEEENPTDTEQKIQHERYNPNRFEQNTKPAKEGEVFRYFVRPYMPFWSAQKLTFEHVNKQSEIPSSRTVIPNICSKRYVFQHLVKTWLNDEPWFDKKEIYELIKEDLILKIDSVSRGYKKQVVGMCVLGHRINHYFNGVLIF